jgi:hypothetical protein
MREANIGNLFARPLQFDLNDTISINKVVLPWPGSWYDVYVKYQVVASNILYQYSARLKLLDSDEGTHQGRLGSPA